MSCLADTNVLLRYVQQNHDMHGVAVAALDFLFGSGETVVIVPQNITEFWNVCTRPTDHNGLGLTPSETDKQVSQLESLFTVLPESPAVYPEWRRLVVTHSVSGVRVYDARLTASMNVYGVKDIVTFNVEDFLRYPGIRVLHPADLAAKQKEK
jgi:predicted nucleic acid-binding protein